MIYILKNKRSWKEYHNLKSIFSSAQAFMKFSFSKYSGCGNDFILIDDRKCHFPTDDKEEIKRLCSRPYGIGADGVILLQNSLSADFTMRIFNADGSEAEMCGNGIRCLIMFIQDLGIEQEVYKIETLFGIIDAKIIESKVSISMGKPKNIRLNIPIEVDEEKFFVHFLNTGVPHVVLFVDDIENTQFEHLGRKFRFHPFFSPEGANFNMAKITNEGIILNRTYERGVEKETLACGTGCVAVAVVAMKLQEKNAPVVVLPRSLEKLEIFPIGKLDALENVRMLGPADKIFCGEIILQLK